MPEYPLARVIEPRQPPGPGPHDPGYQGQCNVPVGNGERCHRRAGAGTDHEGIGACADHVYGNPLGDQPFSVRAVANHLGHSIPTTPSDAMIAALEGQRGLVDWLQQQLLEAGEDDYDRVVRWRGTLSEERERLAKIAKAAHDMGLADRMMEMNEMLARQVVRVINATIDDLHLTPEQAMEAKQRAAQHLRAV